jgi:hypothetical protein
VLSWLGHLFSSEPVDHAITLVAPINSPCERNRTAG